MANQNMRYIGMRWHLPYGITHMCVFGMTGTGKSQFVKACAERAYLRKKFKIIDLYSGGAEEGAYYSLPSNHIFWQDREYTVARKTTKAMNFPTECLIPVCRGMPKNVPNIYSPFTIPINSMTESDLKAILGSDLTKNEIALWRKVNANIKNHTTLPDLLNMIIDAKGADKKDDRTPGISAHGVSSLYNMFSGFEPDRLFSSANNPLAINMLDMLRDKDTVTSLVLKYFPEHYWGFIINYFIHTIYDIVLQGKIKHGIILIIREVGDFLENVTKSPQEEAVKTSMIHILRKGRKHRLFFWTDNQTPLNIDVVRTQFPVKVCMRVDNTEELKGALGDLGSMLLVKDDYSRLMTFGPGRAFILTNSGLFNPQILPPLSRMSGGEGNNFFTIWRSEKAGEFRNITPLINEVEKEYDDSESKWKEILSTRKEKAKQRKRVDREEKERIKMKIKDDRDKTKLFNKLDREVRKIRNKPNIVKVKKPKEYEDGIIPISDLI